ncbi:hypothetical protein D1646_00835 [Pseudoflavonifractor sp. 60]|uniref:WXG100 family type VII secretion target n=1 Tax=Pseudoflavonifractor sp. 60 TaxID=2304576 RepID=UPI00136E47C8|nr:WXG100 family type VII secretion target [Pseudoflavonifractor sp. 60]NBI65374.1 hypothetical protein [Pseudoflavonifractor sp. 60]
MAGQIIEVNTSTLRSDVSEIASELLGIKSDADKLEGVLGQLESMWDGYAKQAFSAAVRDDLSRLRDLVKAMQSLTTKTGQAREEYDKCENTVSQIVSSIKV